MSNDPYKDIGGVVRDEEVTWEDVSKDKTLMQSAEGDDSDNVDANPHEQVLPQDSDVGTESQDCAQPGGSVLQNIRRDLGDQEISLTQENEPYSLSASVKAFFEDTVDAKQEVPSFLYNMTYKFRGCFLIFNHMKFKPKLGMNLRNGTHRDKRNLELTARNLGFEFVRSFDDLKYSEIRKVVSEVAKSDHSEYDCFAVAVLSHGEEGDMLYAYDATYHIDELTQPFMADHCPTLAGKPKLFFIQACRGTKLDEGTPVKVTDIAYKSQVIPNAADFLLAFSTVPGYYAWRNQSEGSWFVQALCKCLNEFGDKLEIMQIMTRVNRMVAYDFMSYSKQKLYFDGKKQIPSIVTRLTSEVFFQSKAPAGRRHQSSVDSGSGKGKTSDLDGQLTDDLKETNL